MSAWRIGRYLGMEPVTGTYDVQLENGELRQSVTFKQKVMHSTVTVKISLDRDADALHYDFTVDWHEIRQAQDYIPVLTYRLPLKKAAETLLTDVPAGAVYREARHIDVPTLTGACAAATATTAALICDCKYGFRLADNVLSCTFINTAVEPDPYPERGIHKINLFVALTDGKPAALKAKGETLIRPMTCVPTASHTGTLPPKHSLLTVDAAHSVITAVQNAKDNALTVRLYEAEGTDDTVTLQLPFTPSKAVLTDLNETILGEVAIENNTVTFPVKAYCLAQVKIYR